MDKTHDENTVRAAFQQLNAGKAESSEAAEQEFFANLVKIHRTGEGAPFTGLKPAGAVEHAVAEADKALASGSPDALVKLITDDVAAGIKERYEHAATTGAVFREKRIPSFVKEAGTFQAVTW